MAARDCARRRPQRFATEDQVSHTVRRWRHRVSAQIQLSQTAKAQVAESCQPRTQNREPTQVLPGVRFADRLAIVRWALAYSPRNVGSPTVPHSSPRPTIQGREKLSTDQPGY